MDVQNYSYRKKSRKNLFNKYSHDLIKTQYLLLDKNLCIFVSVFSWSTSTLMVCQFLISISMRNKCLCLRLVFRILWTLWYHNLNRRRRQRCNWYSWTFENKLLKVMKLSFVHQKATSKFPLKLWLGSYPTALYAWNKDKFLCY